MNESRFPMGKYEELSDTELVTLLVVDPEERLNVVEFIYRKYRRHFLKIAHSRCPFAHPDELASQVGESIVALIPNGAKPVESLRLVADGLRSEFDLLGYVRKILVHKLANHTAQLVRQSQELEFSEDLECQNGISTAPASHELREDICYLRALLHHIKWSPGESLIADTVGFFIDKDDYDNAIDFERIYDEVRKLPEGRKRERKAVRRLIEQFRRRLRASEWGVEMRTALAQNPLD